VLIFSGGKHYARGKRVILVNVNNRFMEDQKYSSGQLYALVSLRLFIGWHFLYEGVVKMYDPTWTAKGYLLSASVLRPFFGWLGSMSTFVDYATITTLLIVGVSLLIGFKTRWAGVLGIALLSLFYLAHPPFPGLPQGPAEGSYWIVNKNLIEIAALWVIMVFPTSWAFGLENILSKKTETAN
jgi:thiosulfate dehydrogenase [quinone] large subunit